MGRKIYRRDSNPGSIRGWPIIPMLHIYMVCLARLCKTHTYPVWGMTTLRQFRSSGPMRAPCSRGLSLGLLVPNVYCGWPIIPMLHIYMVCLARLCKTHTYPVWGMTTLRQFRSSGPMRAPCSRGLSLGPLVPNVYWVLFLFVPGTLAAPCLTCFGFQPGWKLSRGRYGCQDDGRGVAVGGTGAGRRPGP